MASSSSSVYVGLSQARWGRQPADLAILIEVMVALPMVRFVRLWIMADGDGPSQEKVLFPALFAISTYYTGGLRGEETPLMDLHVTAKHYQEGINHHKHPPVVSMALRGRLKSQTWIALRGIDSERVLPSVT